MNFTLRLLTFCLALISVTNKCNTVKKEKPVNRKNESVYTFSKASEDGTGKFYLGREIAQIMGSDGATWLERDERQKEENVELAIEKMNLSPEDVVADIGAGTGYYSFRICRKVPRGKVYAVEIQNDFIKYLSDRKKAINATNIEVVKGNNFSPNLPENSFDLVLMADVYHELEYPREMLQSIKRSLKQTGKFLLLEYRGEDSSLQIKPLHKTTIGQLNRELGANGFRLFYDGEFLPIQHFLVYEKK